jgi:hypothetical protein
LGCQPSRGSTAARRSNLEETFHATPATNRVGLDSDRVDVVRHGNGLLEIAELLLPAGLLLPALLLDKPCADAATCSSVAANRFRDAAFFSRQWRNIAIDYGEAGDWTDDAGASRGGRAKAAND